MKIIGYTVRRRIFHSYHMTAMWLYDGGGGKFNALNTVQTIMSHICHRPTTKVIPSAEYHISVIGMIGAIRPGPSHRSQLSPAGTGGVSVGIAGYCGHTGRLVQLCTSVSVPTIAPALIHAITWVISPLESQGIRWVITLLFRAVSITFLPSMSRLLRGFVLWHAFLSSWRQ